MQIFVIFVQLLLVKGFCLMWWEFSFHFLLSSLHAVTTRLENSEECQSRQGKVSGNCNQRLSVKPAMTQISYFNLSGFVEI